MSSEFGDKKIEIDFDLRAPDKVITRNPDPWV
jgi:hypothetical protein